MLIAALLPLLLLLLLFCAGRDTVAASAAAATTLCWLQHLQDGCAPAESIPQHWPCWQEDSRPQGYQDVACCPVEPAGNEKSDQDVHPACVKCEGGDGHQPGQEGLLAVLGQAI